MINLAMQRSHQRFAYLIQRELDIRRAAIDGQDMHRSIIHAYSSWPQSPYLR